MYIGPNTPRGTNKNPNRVPDLLTKVLPKQLAYWQASLGKKVWERDKMLSAILLAVKNEKLYMENHRQKKKRVKKRTYIARGGVLSGAEGASYA